MTCLSAILAWLIKQNVHPLGRIPMAATMTVVPIYEVQELV